MHRRDDGQWVETIEIVADSKAALGKRTAAVRQVLRKLDREPTRRRRAKGEGTVHQRADGLWVGRIELPATPGGVRQRTRPVYSKDKATVVAALNKLRDDVEKGLPQASKRLRLGDWLTTVWLPDIAKPRMKPHPWNTYRACVANQIVPHIGDRTIADLKPEHVRYMHRQILAGTYTRRGVEIPYSTRTVEAAHNCLSRALNDAVAEGLVHRNVCDLVDTPKVLSRKRDGLTAEQARTMLLAALHRGDRMVTRWAAGLFLGGRQGELLGLQWDRVDFEAGTLDLAWQLEWLPLHPGAKPTDPNRFDVRAGFEHVPLWRGAALTRPKSDASRRLIPLPVPLAAILLEHRKRAPKNPWGLVWVSSQGTPIQDRDDREAWHDACTRADVPEVDVHAMRNTTATLLLEAGVDAHVIASILGHTDVVTTRGYQRVNLALAREALGELDELLHAPETEGMITRR